MEKDTDCVVPEDRVAVMELVTEEPGITDLLPPLEREKSKVGGTVSTVTVLLVAMAL